MEEQKTVVTKYSHAFLVGSFNSNVKPQDLDTKVWKRQILTHQEYSDLLSDYYQSLIDSMVEVEIQDRSDFLEAVCHYAIEIDPECKHKFDICLTKGRVEVPYSYTICLCRLNLYFFPHDIVLMVLEIDDRDIDLNLMTLGHGSLINLKFGETGNEKLIEKMRPLLDLTKEHTLRTLVKDGNNLKIYQVVEVDAKDFNDNLLFEIGTFVPIGAVGGRDGYSPSDTYFNKIIKDNSISVFYNWKALALVDSFTVLGIDGFNKWTWEKRYFPLIYLRCIFEKTFCFSRNSGYRLDKLVKNISQEITDMEKYYFYNNISYNFLPELLYDSMVKGIGLKEEREEVSKQIKEQVKEKEERRNSELMAWVSVFAVFSIAWDFCSIIKEVFGGDGYYSNFVVGILCFAIFVIALLLFLIFKRSLALWSQKSKAKNSNSKKRHILIHNETREHIMRHFSENEIGSKFNNRYTLDSMIEEIENSFPKTLMYAKPDTDGRYRISLTFPEEIGVSNVVSIDELTEEEKGRIEIVDRQDRKVRSVKTDRVIPTHECQIILSDDWHLITMFPGEMAPPLPESPDTHDDYWDNHVFIEPANT